MKPQISIIVPCYNRAEYVDECLNSVLNQTYQDWECIIVNDGSLNNKIEKIALNWTQKDIRFKYIKKENGGLSSARNAGLKIAQGNYIQFLDSDDIILNNKFELQLQILEENRVDIVVSSHDMLYVDNILSECNPRLPDCSINGFVYGWDADFTIPIHASLISKKFLEKYQIFFRDDIKAKEDWIFWVNCTLSNAKFYYHSDRLAHYRVHNSNMTKDKNHMIINNYKALFIVYDLLNDEQKQIFRERMPEIQLNKMIHMLDIKNLKWVPNSKAYRLGKFLLTPFSYIKHKIKPKL